MNRPQKPETHLVVTSREELSPGMVRLWFRSDDLAAYAGSVETDRYVKLLFETADGPVMRTYTVLDPDIETGTLAIDFVVHGTSGVAGPWAASAEPGATITARGPGGGYAPDPSADWYLFAGDAAAVPAIRAGLAALPVDAHGYAVLEVHDREHEQKLDAPGGIDVIWLHTHGGTSALEAAVRALPWLDGRVDAFVHGEAETVMHGIRPYLFTDRALPRKDVSISGYWRQGRTEERFREWKRELASAEQSTDDVAG